MRTAIITFQESTNNGALLQAYALQTVLSGLTDEKCEIINYHSEYKARDYKNRYNGNLLIYLNRMLSKRMRNITSNKAGIFKRKFLNITEKVYYSSDDMKDLNNIYDKFICGSDQVWNPVNTGSDETYFLDFVDNASKIISYAPSIALKKLPDDLEHIYKKNINRFTHLSIREKSGQDIIKNLTGREAKIVLDPTLLLDKNHWDNVLKHINVKEPYIFVYFISYMPQMIDFAKKLHDTTGLKVVVDIKTVRDSYMCLKNGFQRVMTSPEEFVGAISKAEYVITNSFHGTAFSINYQKVFFAFGNKGNLGALNNRMTDLLNLLNLEDSFITDNTLDVSMLINNSIKDFSTASNLLNTLKNDSMDYLKAALNN